MAVKVWEPMTKEGSDGDAEIRRIVLPATTNALADGARDTGVPYMLIGGAPGVKILPATTY